MSLGYQSGDVFVSWSSANASDVLDSVLHYGSNVSLHESTFANTTTLTNDYGASSPRTIAVHHALIPSMKIGSTIFYREFFLLVV